jgi:hypothetical protein
MFQNVGFYQTSSFAFAQKLRIFSKQSNLIEPSNSLTLLSASFQILHLPIAIEVTR